MTSWQTYQLDKEEAKRIGVDDRLVVVRTQNANSVFGKAGIADEALRQELESAVGADPALADRFGVAIGRLQPPETESLEAPRPPRRRRRRAPTMPPTASEDEPPVEPAPAQGAACPSCSEPLEAGHRFCIMCGTPSCSACGAECPKDAKFCVECGAKRA